MTSAPSPVPLSKVIPQLTVTAARSDTGQVVPGTFTITGANTTALRSGTAAGNVDIVPLTKTVTIVTGTGKPITETMPICPTVTFQPDQPLYAPGSFPQIISCNGV